MTHPRVKMVAISANEAYFLPIWVYHHFYMGFDSIDIYVNRTQDNSMAVLSKLKTVYPRLNIYNADWVDAVRGNRMGIQAIVYAYSYFNTLSDYDYVMFADIDEYWLSREEGATIQHCIRSYNYPDMVSFLWTNIGGRDEFEFPMVTDMKISGWNSSLSKSVVKTNIPFTEIGVHVQFFDYNASCYCGDGEILRQDPEIPARPLTFSKDKPTKYFILHDWMRSPIFHLANMDSGYCASERRKGSQNIKPNKMLYHSGNDANPVRGRLESSVTYKNNYQKLLATLDLQDEMQKAKLFKYYQALNMIRILATMTDRETAENILARLGSVEELHHNVLVKMIDIDPSLGDLKNVGVMHKQNIVRGTVANTLANITRAVRLYPYATDEYGQPEFAKMHIQYMLEHGLFAEALQAVVDYSDAYGDVEAWSNLLFARAYEQAGNIPEALRRYRLSQYSGKGWILQKIAELESNGGQRSEGA